MPIPRWVLIGAIGLSVTGCLSPPERLEMPPAPLDAADFSLQDALIRARFQASAATDAFYIDNWQALETAASTLEATARSLGSAKDIPVDQRAEIEREANELASYAQGLGEAARAKDVESATEGLQQIALRLRTLQLGP